MAKANERREMVEGERRGRDDRRRRERGWGREVKVDREEVRLGERSGVL